MAPFIAAYIRKYDFQSKLKRLFSKWRFSRNTLYLYNELKYSQIGNVTYMYIYVYMDKWTKCQPLMNISQEQEDYSIIFLTFLCVPDCLKFIPYLRRFLKPEVLRDFWKSRRPFWMTSSRNREVINIMIARETWNKACLTSYHCCACWWPRINRCYVICRPSTIKFVYYRLSIYRGTI